MASIDQLFLDINTFILDVDGVLTDGMVHPFADGEFARVFNIKDGYAIEKALLSGYHICIISGGFEKGVQKRLEFLKIPHIYLGIKDKLPVMQQFMEVHQIKPHQVLYMGDDMPDFEVMKHVGIAACPADASADIIDISNYISSKQGGKGAVREVIEKTMKLQGTWQKVHLSHTS
jgi:3-deoxy-D-manno-octulosonate 8-phosphate phosphatase (KDO 8-P phosphatase)